MLIIDPFVLHVVTVLRQAGYETYIVGGAVRDILLKRKPKDYDVSTAAEPEQIRTLFGRRRAVIIGRRFRLVHVRNGQQIVEVSTFRRPPIESAGSPGGSKPDHMLPFDNNYGNSREDAFRRDFTVNALFYDPVDDKLHDFTARGQDDLQARVIRVIGDPAERFREDPVRMLRALKLVGQYDFTLEPQSLAALQDMMALIVHVSPSRLTLEFEKILRSPYGLKILKTFREYGFLKYFLPHLDRYFITPQATYAMNLLKQYNMRLQLETFRDSASLAIAALALPFAEQQLGGERGKLWCGTPRQNASIITQEVEKMIEPHQFCQRIRDTAVSILLMQPQFLYFDGDIQRLTASRAYVRARELSLIQNEVQWRFTDWDERFPAETPGFFHDERNASAPPQTLSPKKKHRPRRRRKIGRKPDAPFDSHTFQAE